MSGDAAHAASVSASHLRNRSCMICCCCAADSSNSCAGSFARRLSRMLKHLRRLFPAGANDKDSSKALFVLAMTLSHAQQDSSIGLVHLALLGVVTTRQRQRSSFSAHAVRQCEDGCGRPPASLPRADSASTRQQLERDFVRPRMAAWPPNSRPRLGIRSKRGSPPLLHRTVAHSNAPGLASSEQTLEKLLQQIACDVEPVKSAGTNVINRSDF